jgi:hypothetical protein
MVAAGAVVGQAGAQVEGAAVPGGSAPKIPARRDVVRVGGQRAAAAEATEGDFQAGIGLFNASTRGSVHVIVDISGYFR